MEIATTLQAAYNEQYSGVSEWRAIGAKYKAANIATVCQGHKFDKVLECGAGEGSVLQALADTGVFPEFCRLKFQNSGLAAINQRHIPSLVEARKFDGYALPFPTKRSTWCISPMSWSMWSIRASCCANWSAWHAFRFLEVPLDYSIGCDKNIDIFLAYGHPTSSPRRLFAS